MQNQLRDNEPPPLGHPFEFEEDLFEDYGNTSNFPIQTRPLAGTTQSVLKVEYVDIKSLSAILRYEWLTEAELSPEVARIITPPTILLCQIRGSARRVHYNPYVGINVLSRVS